MPEITRPHDFRQLISIPLDENGIPCHPDGERTVDIKIGCFTCNMGFEEAKTCNCPGQDLFDNEAVFGGTEDDSQS